ncbi:DUF2306 domain-containing protein [Nesterenkonia lutea]|uniref:DUF2306 domain-containing protein n=1 Tax=Nesterenkonia lutea TaxID=272919 RepID=A0ABR9JDJ7_9MICC|nr:DUF2306 domain-containing protein [Nesterenkonia lutea]MBE1524002.1 hypothetical protein [Nesterenkonia lutea]
MKSAQEKPTREWMIAAGLLLLALVPSLAGGVRLGEIAAGGPETPANSRFMQFPLPVALHIMAALIYSILGAFQFLPSLRRRRLRWHMFAGRFLVLPSGVIVAVTGLWMTAIYRMPPVDGPALAASRCVVGLAMLAFLGMAVTAVARRDYRTHGEWMIRAYALALGAGTQVLTSAPFMIAFGPPDELARLIQMDAGWLLNALAAELIIRRRRSRAATTSPALRLSS